MYKTIHLFLFCFLSSISLIIAQEKATLSGVVTDDSSNETLIGVTVAIPSLQTGAVTNEYGFYSIRLPKGSHDVQISFMGFKTITKTVDLTEDTTLNFNLEEALESLDEVVITENVESISIRKPEMSVNKLSLQTIKSLPVVLGEVDIIKSLLLLPGVTNAGEGSSGFNVRGGAVDQNLILLDEATIFNSSHLFGFFSVFNPDAIKDLKLYKGGIPARYGGRVSSVLDIYQKDGNSKNFHMNGGIGLISSRLLAEGPIVKDKGSFLVGGRSSYAHLFLKLSDNDNTAFFYDLNTKLKYKFNDSNSLFLSGYFGRDVFNLSDSFKNSYGNTVLNLRWNHVFNDRLFSNLSLIYSDYFYGLELDFVKFDWESGIKNTNLKYDLKHYISNNLKLSYGLHNTYFEFNPGEIRPQGEDSGINEQKLTQKYALENAAYVSAEHKINDKLNVEYGVRFSSFTRFGQTNTYIYENDNPILYNSNLEIYEKAAPIDTINTKGDVEKWYGNLEPRIAVSYAINDQQSIKASYNRMTQNLHLLSNTTSPTPLDVWTPSGETIKPQLLDQFALGYFRTFKDRMYSLQTEAFYKKLQNRINYIDGADLIANETIEQVILNGEGRAYGFEFLLKKELGKLTGWLAYTWSRSEERVPGRTPIEPGINNGEWFVSNYDKTHDLTLTTAYKLSPKWKVSANLTYQTGRPTTYPNGQYEFNGIVIPNYEGRNTDRLPDYHRLDISATYTPKPQKQKGWQSEWVFGIYNLYNRRNAASISFRQNEDTLRNEAVRFSIFGIVPSISYNFKF